MTTWPPGLTSTVGPVPAHVAPRVAGPALPGSRDPLVTPSPVAGPGNTGHAVAQWRGSHLPPVASAPSAHLGPAAACQVPGLRLPPGLGTPGRGAPGAGLLSVSEPAGSAGVGAGLSPGLWCPGTPAPPRKPSARAFRRCRLQGRRREPRVRVPAWMGWARGALCSKRKDRLGARTRQGSPAPPGPRCDTLAARPRELGLPPCVETGTCLPRASPGRLLAPPRRLHGLPG